MRTHGRVRPLELEGERVRVQRRRLADRRVRRAGADVDDVGGHRLAEPMGPSKYFSPFECIGSERKETASDHPRSGGDHRGIPMG